MSRFERAKTHKYICKRRERFYWLNAKFCMAFILKSGADILGKCDSNPLPLSDRLTELLWLQDKFGVFCIFATSAFNGKTIFSEGQLCAWNTSNLKNYLPESFGFFQGP